MVWFGLVRDHPGSLKIAPFDTTHTSFYDSVPYWSKVVDCNLFGAPVGLGVTHWTIVEIFGVNKLKFLSYRVASFA